MRELVGRDQGDVWPIPRPAAAPLHPTQKPLALVERAIEHSSPPGATVLDPFCGSRHDADRLRAHGAPRRSGSRSTPAPVAATIARWEAFTGEAPGG